MIGLYGMDAYTVWILYSMQCTCVHLPLLLLSVMVLHFDYSSCDNKVRKYSDHQ